ncbi:MAG: 6-bladed beta-propeller, partial [Microbacteriaceae bacterium]|nr:6-bladed beta-propeller [Microbacteriaceae bacterium]
AVGGEGTGPGQFWLPIGLWIDSRDRVWVTDGYNRRIQVFQYLAEAPVGGGT